MLKHINHQDDCINIYNVMAITKEMIQKLIDAKLVTQVVDLDNLDSIKAEDLQGLYNEKLITIVGAELDGNGAEVSEVLVVPGDTEISEDTEDMDEGADEGTDESVVESPAEIVPEVPADGGETVVEEPVEEPTVINEPDTVSPVRDGVVPGDALPVVEDSEVANEADTTTRRTSRKKNDA